MIASHVFAGKTVAVFGLARTGLSAIASLTRGGASVIAWDDNNLAREAGANAGAQITPWREWGWSGIAALVLSPGVPLTHPRPHEVVLHASRAGVPVIGDVELFAREIRPDPGRRGRAPVIAITGTNGKTTTTQLVERMLNACGVRTVAAGNIGPAFAARVRESARADVMTLEVSSFQLETIRAFRPAISVWLNFQADHLDRYASMEEYRRAKLRIFENQTDGDTAIVKLEDKLPPIKARKITFSAYTQGGDLDLREGGVIHFHGKPVLRMADTQLRGLHNAENLMAALAVGAVRGLDFAAMTEALRTYRALPHRCERIATVDGVEYVNDSKATNLDALEKALLSEARPVVLIAGGKDKGFEFDSLTGLVASKAHDVVLIGEMAGRIAGFWSPRVPCHRAGSLAEAVRLSRALARDGDVVLFSPGTSSFDMFKSYADRGNQFRNLVQSFTDSGL